MNFRREATRGEEGMALFREIRSLYPDMPIILLTAWTHLEMAVELVKAGASDYIAKPWDDARLLTTVRNLLDLRRAQSETRAIHAAAPRGAGGAGGTASPLRHRLSERCHAYARFHGHACGACGCADPHHGPERRG